MSDRGLEKKQDYLQLKARYKKRTLEKTRLGLQIVLSVLAISAMLILLLFNQSKIVEINFKNSQLNSSIKEVKISNIQKESELVALKDYEDIKTRAYLMGFQEPSKDQIIYLAVPKQDRMVIADNSEEIADVNGDLPRQDINFGKLEGFFRSLKP